MSFQVQIMLKYETDLNLTRWLSPFLRREVWLSVVIKLNDAGLRFLDTFNCIPFSEFQFFKRIQPSVCNSYYVVKFCISSSNGPNFKISNLFIVQKRLCFYVWPILSKSLLKFYFIFSLHKETALICKNWGSSFHHVYL